MITVIDNYTYFIDDEEKAMNNEWGYCPMNGAITNIPNGQYRLKLLACDNPAIRGLRIPVKQFIGVVANHLERTTQRSITPKGERKVKALYYKGATIQDALSAVILIH